MEDAEPLSLVPTRPTEFDIRWLGDSRADSDEEGSDGIEEKDSESQTDKDKAGNDKVGSETPGSRCEVRQLYNHASDHRPQWSLHEDPILEGQRLKALSQPFAIVHRRARDGRDEWATHSVEIQSPKLKAILNTVFEGYPNWQTDKDPFTFRPPFHPFFHRWDKLSLSLRAQETDEEKSHLHLLLKVLVPEITTFAVALEEFNKTRLIRFSDLWLIFPPGELVVAEIDGSTCVVRLRKTTLCSGRMGQPDLFLLEVEQLDWNGSYCGYKELCLTIVEFAAPTLVTKLSVYPLRCAAHEQDLRTKLVRRGRLFAKYRGFHTMWCKGTKHVIAGSGEDKEAKPVSSFMSGRLGGRWAGALTQGKPCRSPGGSSSTHTPSTTARAKCRPSCAKPPARIRQACLRA